MDKPLFKYINEPVKILDDGNYQKIPQPRNDDDTQDIRFHKRKPTPVPVSLSPGQKPYTVLCRYPLIIRWNDGRLEEIPNGILPDEKEEPKENPAVINYMDDKGFKNGEKTRQNNFRILEEDGFTPKESEDSLRSYQTMEYRLPQTKPQSALSDFQKKPLQDRLEQIAYLQRQQDL